MKCSEEDMLSYLDRYTALFPDERGSLAEFRRFAERFRGADRYDRKNFTGHVTVSAIIADPAMERFLLLWHKGLGKWLQPGGHVEPADMSLLSGAFREVEEETGLSREKYDVMSMPDGFCIIELDSHHIPRNDKRGEGVHYHHDVRFLFRLRSAEDVDIEPDKMESGGYRWVTRDEFSSCFGSGRAMQKLKFFQEVIQEEELRWRF